VLIAKRLRDDGPEVIYPGHEWQMPQGGIDASEDPRPAALRELYEETGVTSVAYLGETPDWMAYDYPPYDGPPHRLAAFRGQRQKWFAFRFTGEDSEIDISVERAADGGDPEFGEWRWERLERLPDLVVPFRREVYLRVVLAFAKFVPRLTVDKES
jgi:putative (di)nucleoside polyphosphate hydrolase